MILNINGTRFTNFSSFNITLTYNAIASKFSFTALNNDFPLPYSYADVEVLNDDGELLLTGTLVAHEPISSAKPSLIRVSGYSKPGVLEDGNIPIELYPLQSDNLSLREIAEKLFEPYGIEYVANPIILTDFNKRFPKSTANTDPSIKSHLTGLCAQRNIVLSQTAKGEVFFTRVEVFTLNPVTHFENLGMMQVGLSANGQLMHSSITVVKQASIDNPDSAQFTIENPYVNVFRPKVQVMTSGDLFDVEKAAKAALASELGTMKFTINTTKFIKPGNLITLTSDYLKIKDRTELFVEQTEIKRTTKSETYTLTCVLKEVYDTDIPIIPIFE